MNEIGYVVRYGVLKAAHICNLCGPMELGPNGWSARDLRRRKEAGSRYIQRLNNHNGFYRLLEESILSNGIRNPILVSSGHVPEQKKDKVAPKNIQDINRLLFCFRQGGSRLWIAQKHNLSVPCIISDFNDNFSHLELLSNENDIMNKFLDQPKQIYFKKDGVEVENLPHVHLKG